MKKVGRTWIATDDHSAVVDTCIVKLKNSYYYETGIKIDDGDWIITDRYPSKSSAEIGHEYWVMKCVDDEWDFVMSLDN